MTSNFNDIIDQIEEEFFVVYPIINNATYKSLVNYSTDIKKPIQRWYRYKEWYSIELVEKFFKEYWLSENSTILDPFSGSWSTLLQAKINNQKSFWFEVNPFTILLSEVKTQNYSSDDHKELLLCVDSILNEDNSINLNKIPKLSTINKLFNSDTLEYLLTIKTFIDKIKNHKVKSALFLWWLSILEEASNYKKAWNWLKKRVEKQVKIRDLNFVKDLLQNKLKEIIDDLDFAIKISKNYEPKIIRDSSKNIIKYIEGNSIDWVFFSPPYANCFDYTEIYKVELWMWNFVDQYEDLKPLRNIAIRSHLNWYKPVEIPNERKFYNLNILIGALNNVELWDKRIPTMVQNYFLDMFSIMNQLNQVMKKWAVCWIVVGNSSYWWIIVPTDLLLSHYAKNNWFEVIKIEVARFIITSSQQYKKTEKYKKYLRESIIHLKKI